LEKKLIAHATVFKSDEAEAKSIEARLELGLGQILMVELLRPN